MNHLKLGLLLTLCCITFAVAFNPSISDLIVPLSPYNKRVEFVKIKNKKLNKKPAKKQNDDDADEEEEGDDDDRILAACTKDAICTCNAETLNCDKTTDPSDNSLLINTVNVEVRAKRFKAVTASFRGNQIKEITANILPGQELNVQVLDLTDNLISSIDTGAFDNLENLRKLRLNHNLLKTLDSTVFSSDLGESLHELQLANNQIRTIKPKTFKNMKNLKTLSLDENPGIILNAETFKGLTNLEKLSLDNCDIEELDDNVFKYLTNLKELSLIGNPITTIPKAINAIPHLVALDLSNTSLPELNSGEISSDHQLQELYINHMFYLYAIHENGLSGLPKLKKLDASNNPHLYEIHQNAFGDKSEGAEKDIALTELYLSNCNFSTLPSTLLDYQKLEHFEIDGNPFVCDCNMAWLINDQSMHHFKQAPTCAKPVEVKDKTFAQLMKTMCDSSTIVDSSNRLITSFLLLMIIIALIIGFLLYTRRLRMTNIAYQPEMPQMGYSNLSAQQHREDELQLQDDFENPAQIP